MDAKLMVQVVINIVDNAIKYTPAGSDVIAISHKLKVIKGSRIFSAVFTISAYREWQYLLDSEEKIEQMYDILETSLAGIVLSELSMKPAE